MNIEYLKNWKGHIKLILLPILIFLFYQLTDLLILSIMGSILLWVFILILLTKPEQEEEQEED